jgi:hypothetical protein
MPFEQPLQRAKAIRELSLNAEPRQDNDTEHSGPGVGTDRRPDFGDKAFREHRKAGSQLRDKLGGAFRCREMVHRQLARGRSSGFDRQLNQPSPGAGTGPHPFQGHNPTGINVQQRLGS